MVCTAAAVRVYVQLLPCRNIRFSGVCQLTVSAQTVQLRAAVDDESERQVEPARPLVQWPVSSIRHCGYSDKLLLLRTTESVSYTMNQKKNCTRIPFLQ